MGRHVKESERRKRAKGAFLCATEAARIDVRVSGLRGAVGEQLLGAHGNGARYRPRARQR